MALIFSIGIETWGLSLSMRKKQYVLKQSIQNEPIANAPWAKKDAYKKHLEDALDFSYLMFATMNFELQKQHENMEAFNMIGQLK